MPVVESTLPYSCQQTDISPCAEHRRGCTSVPRPGLSPSGGRAGPLLAEGSGHWEGMASGTPARSHFSPKSATIGTVKTRKDEICAENPHRFDLGEFLMGWAREFGGGVRPVSSYKMWAGWDCGAESGEDSKFRMDLKIYITQATRNSPRLWF
eukprot:jgi/Botrbrau1/9779/Bobra.85_1s0023.1